jgi:hypothetical protein
LIPKNWRASLRLARAFTASTSLTNHHLVLANIKIQLKSRLFTARRKFAVDSLKEKETQDLFAQKVTIQLQQQQHGVQPQPTPTEKLKIITCSLTQTAGKVLGFQEKPRTKWISNNTLQLISRRNQLKGARKMGFSRRLEFAILRQRIKYSIRQDKDQYFRNEIIRMENNPNTCFEIVNTQPAVKNV